MDDLMDDLMCFVALDVCTVPPTLNSKWFQRYKDLSL